MIYDYLKIIFYGTFVAGVFLYSFEISYKNLTSFARKKRRLGEYEYYSENEKKKLQGIKKEIAMLLNSTTGDYGVKAVNNFIFLSILIGLVALFIFFLLQSIIIGLFSGIVLMCTPYLILRIKLEFLRINSSKEADLVIGGILNYYKLNYCNMKEAIEKTALELTDAPNSKVILMNLAKDLNNAKDEDDIQEHLEKMKYGFGTTWASVLSSNIYFAEVLGIKVTTSLIDLLNLIKNNRKIIEFEKRENNEGNLIMKYLVPLTYILSIAIACYFFDFTIVKFIEYQFFTTTGLLWFLIICITSFIGYVVIFLLSKRKMDV